MRCNICIRLECASERWGRAGDGSRGTCAEMEYELEDLDRKMSTIPIVDGKFARKTYLIESNL